jgi:hypothetical protein
MITKDADRDIDGKIDADVGNVILSDTGVMAVHNTVPCESKLVSKQDVTYKLCG